VAHENAVFRSFPAERESICDERLHDRHGEELPSKENADKATSQRIAFHEPARVA